MKLRLIVPMVLALAVVTGCGGDDEPAAEPRDAAEQWADPRAERERRDGALVVEADPSGAPAFRQDALEVAAGRVTLELVNPSSTSHSLCVEAPNQGVLGCTGTFRGDRGTLRLRLQPGRYTFFCSVPGHRAAGMSGSLTVQ